MFAWQTEFDLGIDKINGEHKKLIALMEELFQKSQTQAPHAQLAQCLKQLADYTVFHFAEEEAYMASIGFPGIETHKLIHKRLLSKLGELSAEFDAKRQGLSEEFFEFLNMWLSSHIKGIDKKYCEHVPLKRAG